MGIPGTVDHPHDDDFAVREPVVQHVVAVKMHPQPLGQAITPRADLGVQLHSREALLDLADQLRRRPAVVLGDEAPDVDKILLSALG